MAAVLYTTVKVTDMQLNTNFRFYDKNNYFNNIRIHFIINKCITCICFVIIIIKINDNKQIN